MDFLSANSRFAVQNDGMCLPQKTRETVLQKLTKLTPKSNLVLGWQICNFDVKNIVLEKIEKKISQNIAAALQNPFKPFTKS